MCVSSGQEIKSRGGSLVFAMVTATGWVWLVVYLTLFPAALYALFEMSRYGTSNTNNITSNTMIDTRGRKNSLSTLGKRLIVAYFSMLIFVVYGTSFAIAINQNERKVRNGSITRITCMLEGNSFEKCVKKDIIFQKLCFNLLLLLVFIQ